MNFERINYYREFVKKNNLDNLSTDDLAWECRESSPKEWIRVNNNCVKTFQGEQRKVLKNPNTNKNEVWMYRATKQFDPILFCNLYIRVSGFIPKLWNKYKDRLGDSEIFMDNIEEAILQTLIRYDKSKGHFSSLVYRMMNNYSINLIQKNTNAKFKKDKETGKIHTEYNYASQAMSLDAILEDEKSKYKYELPIVEDSYFSIVTELKNKYKQKQDLITWLILDWQEDIPEITNIKEVSNNVNIKKYSVKNIFDSYTCLIQNNNFKKLGFFNCNNNMVINVFRNRYKKSLQKLKEDMEEYLKG